MCKNLRNMCYVESVTDDTFETGFKPAIIDDTSAFEMLCPVSSVTGHRGNPLDALSMTLKPSVARAVGEVLQEIPAGGLPSDDGSFTGIVERLNMGTDAERAIYLEKLQSIADDLYKIRPALKPKVDSVKFGDDDKKVVDNV